MRHAIALTVPFSILSGIYTIHGQGLSIGPELSKVAPKHQKAIT